MALSARQDRGAACAIDVSPTGLVVTIPEDAPGRSDIHIIVEAVDDGEPALTGYARIILALG